MPNGLIVSSDPEDSLRVSEVFRECGFSVTTAEDFESAQDLLLKETPEVAMIDLHVSTSLQRGFVTDSQFGNPSAEAFCN